MSLDYSSCGKFGLFQPPCGGFQQVALHVEDPHGKDDRIWAVFSYVRGTSDFRSGHASDTSCASAFNGMVARQELRCCGYTPP